MPIKVFLFNQLIKNIYTFSFSISFINTRHFLMVLSMKFHKSFESLLFLHCTNDIYLQNETYSESADTVKAALQFFYYLGFGCTSQKDRLSGIHFLDYSIKGSAISLAKNKQNNSFQNIQGYS